MSILTLVCASVSWAQIDQGPGGPILVVSSGANPFSRYYAEILRNEGLNEFQVSDISTVSAGTLAGYDVVILGDMPLSSAQVSLFNNYVAGGGNLIAMRPDKQLAGLLGLADAGGTLSEGYLLANTSVAPGAGLVAQTIQFHGAADRYSPSGSTVVATLYATATSATSHPAVTLRSFGSGQAAAFTYDLARSVVYTRQGNPAWVGQSRYHPGSPYVADLFYPDWVDRSKMHIPQADEQMRLLANLIQHMNRAKKPLPRFWYLPFSKKFAVMMTSDDHGTNATPSRFDGLNSLSPAGCNVANWECARATAYVFPNHPAANGMSGYQAQGHEISLHFSPPSLYTPASIDAAMNTQVNQFRAALPNLLPPVSQRAHAGTAWSDYASQAVAGARYGVRLDHNFMPDPYAYYNANPGFFTGSAQVMRFANADGTMIDQYQAPTQVIDGTGQNLPTWPNPILDRGIGPEGFYGFMSVLIHSDYTWQNSAAFSITSAALSRGIPVISARQALTWLDGRNNSSFSAIGWNGSRLSFNVNAAPGSNGLRVMLPVNMPAGALNSVLQNGSAIGYTIQTIKGVDYAFFAAASAAYQAVYGAGGPLPPTVTSVAPTGTGISAGTAVTANFSLAMNAGSFNTSTFALRANGAGANVAATVGASGSAATLVPSVALAPGTTYTATIASSVTSAAGAPLGSSYSWSFTTAAAVVVAPVVTGVSPNGSGVAIPGAITVSFSQAMNAAAFASSTAGLYLGGVQVGASLSLSGSVLTITPNTPLAAGTTYSVSISGTVTNTSGVAMGSGFTSSFTTAAAATGGALAGWWQFNEGGGALTSDSSGNGNALALNGSTWTAGYSGTALAYNAGVGLASVTPSAALNNHTEFTWAAWVRPTGEMGRGIGPVIERGAGSDLRRTLSFGPLGSSAPGTVTGVVRAGTNATSEAQLNSYTLNTWAHWAMTYSDAGDRRIHLYKNGVEVAYRSQVPATGALVGDAGSGLGIGATPGSLFYGFTGVIDDVRIYSRVLNGSELLALAGGVSGPSVVSSSPRGVSVPTGTTVSATFDRAMSAASFTNSTFTLRSGGGSNVPASVSVSDATATLTPSGALPAGTTYTATILSSVTDAGGVALGANYTWTFTTVAAAAPVVSSWSPAGSGASLSPSVAVTFNRAMNAGSFNSSTFTLRANGAGVNVPAAVSLSGATATLTPAVALASNTTYVVTVAATVTDGAGVPLGSAFSWTFTTAAGPGLPTPVGWWTLNEGSGASVTDASGQGSNGTAVNTAWTTGRTGSALSFNGVNSVVNFGSPAPLTNLSSFTWTLWAAAAGEMSRGIGPVLEKGSGSNSVKSFSFGALQSSSPRTVSATVRAGGAFAIAEAAIGSYDQGVWAHWTITYDDAGDRKIRIYKNGVEVAYRLQTAASGTLAPDAGLNLAMGSTPDSQFFAFQGAIDDVRIFPRVLTVAEIQAVAAQ